MPMSFRHCHYCFHHFIRFSLPFRFRHYYVTLLLHYSPLPLPALLDCR
jgi:hypothetical protein